MTVPLGYWLRFHAPIAPGLRDALGGIAYVVFWILALTLIQPRLSEVRAAVSVFAASCLVEILQLWHPRWLEQIRATLPGRLVLGTTFQWTDFPPYALGAVAGYWLLRAIQPGMRPKRAKPGR